jgi:hypothetical protein
MANFIKIGERYVNLDLVTDVQYDLLTNTRDISAEEQIVISFNAPASRTIRLRKEEAQALLAWLDLGAIDVMQQQRERAERDNPERFA